jgi:hypothetical protein
MIISDYLSTHDLQETILAIDGIAIAWHVHSAAADKLENRDCPSGDNLEPYKAIALLLAHRGDHCK